MKFMKPSKFTFTKPNVSLPRRLYHTPSSFEMEFGFKAKEKSAENLARIKKSLGELRDKERLIVDKVRDRLWFQHVCHGVDEVPTHLVPIGIRKLFEKDISNAVTNRNRGSDYVFGTLSIGKNKENLPAWVKNREGYMVSFKLADLIAANPIYEQIFVTNHLRDLHNNYVSPLVNFQGNNFQFFMDAKTQTKTYVYRDKTGDEHKEIVKFEDEVFTGKDILEAIGLSLVWHMRKITRDYKYELNVGMDYEKIVFSLMNVDNKEVVSSLMKHIMGYQVFPEAKFPGVIDLTKLKNITYKDKIIPNRAWEKEYAYKNVVEDGLSRLKKKQNLSEYMSEIKLFKKYALFYVFDKYGYLMAPASSESEKKEFYEKLQLLLDYGLDLNEVDEDLNTPLMSYTNYLAIYQDRTARYFGKGGIINNVLSKLFFKNYTKYLEEAKDYHTKLLNLQSKDKYIEGVTYGHNFSHMNLRNQTLINEYGKSLVNVFNKDDVSLDTIEKQEGVKQYIVGPLMDIIKTQGGGIQFYKNGLLEIIYNTHAFEVIKESLALKPYELDSNILFHMDKREVTTLHEKGEVDITKVRYEYRSHISPEFMKPYHHARFISELRYNELKAQPKLVAIAVVKGIDKEGKAVHLMGKKSLEGKFMYPGGYADIGEEPIEAAIRELKEETYCDLSNLVKEGKVIPSIIADETIGGIRKVFVEFDLKEMVNEINFRGRDDLPMVALIKINDLAESKAKKENEAKYNNQDSLAYKSTSSSSADSSMFSPFNMDLLSVYCDPFHINFWHHMLHPEDKLSIWYQPTYERRHVSYSFQESNISVGEKSEGKEVSTGKIGEELEKENNSYYTNYIEEQRNLSEQHSSLGLS